MRYKFNEEKNIVLKERRGVDFEDVIVAIEKGFLLEVRPHPDLERYPGQEVYILSMNGYTYVVPFVRTGTTIFLKTLFPSRKEHKKYFSNIGINDEK